MKQRGVNLSEIEEDTKEDPRMMSLSQVRMKKNDNNGTNDSNPQERTKDETERAKTKNDRGFENAYDSAGNRYSS